MRREFIELAKGKTAPIATEALQRIAALYAVEAEVRGQPPEIRRAVRQARSRPLVEDLFAWLEAQLARLPGGSPTAKAIRYALNHREGLLPVPRRRPHRARHEHGRARHPARCASAGRMRCSPPATTAGRVGRPWPRWWRPAS